MAHSSSRFAAWIGLSSAGWLDTPRWKRQRCDPALRISPSSRISISLRSSSAPRRPSFLSVVITPKVREEVPCRRTTAPISTMLAAFSSIMPQTRGPATEITRPMRTPGAASGAGSALPLAAAPGRNACAPVARASTGAAPLPAAAAFRSGPTGGRAVAGCCSRALTGGCAATVRSPEAVGSYTATTASAGVGAGAACRGELAGAGARSSSRPTAALDLPKVGGATLAVPNNGSRP